MDKPTLADLTAFLMIADQRSFRKAADAMGVSRSTLSHTIRDLEQNIGVRLLHRTTRSVSPTEAGQHLLDRLRPVLLDLDRALDAVSEQRGRPSGALRINANEAGVRVLLKTVVPTFLATYPDMTLDLVAEGRLIDIVEGGFDAGVRLAEAVPQDMISIRLGEDLRFVPVAAPGLLTGREPPATPDDLRHHHCIRQRLPSGKVYRWEFEKRGHEVMIDPPGPLTLDNTGLMVEAAVDALGIAYVPEPAARQRIEEGRLVVLLESWCPVVPGLRLYYSGHRHVPAGLRVLIDLIKESDAN